MKSYVDKPEALLEYVVSEPMLKAGALDAMRQDEKGFHVSCRAAGERHGHSGGGIS